MVDQESKDVSSAGALGALGGRLSQVIAHLGISQAKFACAIGISPGFVSDIVRGQKKPGSEFLLSVKQVFGVSADWLLSGDGTMFGAVGIDQNLLRSIQLYIALAKSSVIEQNVTARALVLLLKEGRQNEIENEPSFSPFLDGLSHERDDFDFAVELYNGHIWTQDLGARQQNLLSSAIAHFEAKKPIDRLAILTNSAKPKIQVVIGDSVRNSGRDFYEN